MAIPGIKVIAPSTPADAKGLLASAIRDPDPVLFFEHKSLLANKASARREHVEPLGNAKVLRTGADADHRARRDRPEGGKGRGGSRG